MKLNKMTTEKLRVSSFIRGCHAYMNDWEPTIGDKYSLEREPSNKNYSNAVAIIRRQAEQDQGAKSRRVAIQRNIENLDDTNTARVRDGISQAEVLGYVPKLMALWLTKFLKRPTNSGEVIVKGNRVNRGGGYGLEVPCEYQFNGDTFSCDWLKEKLTKEKFKVLE